MKTRILSSLTVLLLALSGAPLYALRPGDPAEELAVKWIRGVPLAVLPPAKEELKTGELKAVVFLLTRSANAPETLNLLNQLRRTYSGSVRFAVVTPDRETDAAAMLRERPDFKLPVAVDTDRKITSQYMSGNLLFPMAFLFDREGEIVWSGEAAYLGEALQKCLDGTLDRDAQRKLSPLLDELPTLLRGDNESRMRRLVDSIFRIEPGQPTALRIRFNGREAGILGWEPWELELGRPVCGRNTLEIEVIGSRRNALGPFFLSEPHPLRFGANEFREYAHPEYRNLTAHGLFSPLELFWESSAAKESAVHTESVHLGDGMIHY